jgi:hypothetical protein
VDLRIYELVYLQAKQEVKTVKAVASLGNKLEQLRQRVAGLVGKMAASSLVLALFLLRTSFLLCLPFPSLPFPSLPFPSLPFPSLLSSLPSPFPTQAVRALLEDEPVDSWRARFGTSELERVEIVAIAESIQKTTGNKIEALDEDLKSVLSYQRTVYTLGMGHNIPTKET